MVPESRVRPVLDRPVRPDAALERLDDPTESDLKKICVDESQNPQND